MADFCFKCGKELKEGVSFCRYCGAAKASAGSVQIQQPQPPPQPDDTQLQEAAQAGTGKWKKAGIITITAGVITIIAGVLLFYFLIMRVTYKTPIENYCRIGTKDDIKYIEKVYPDFVLEKMGYYEDGILPRLEASLKSTKACKIGDKEELSDERLRKMEGTVKNKYGKEINIETGYKVDAEIDRGDGYKSTEFVVYKFDGKWYMWKNND